MQVLPAQSATCLLCDTWDRRFLAFLVLINLSISLSSFSAILSRFRIDALAMLLLCLMHIAAQMFIAMMIATLFIAYAFRFDYTLYVSSMHQTLFKCMHSHAWLKHPCISSMIEFKYLATRSGKSLVVSIGNRKYMFDLFEGLQRYCIEAGVSLSKVSALFLCTDRSVPPLVGTYLTLRDIGRVSLDIVCDSTTREIAESASRFADLMDMKMNYMSSYSDEYVSVEMVSSAFCSRCIDYTCIHTKAIIEHHKHHRSIQNWYFLDIKPIRGRLMADRIPKEIPKHMYSMLTRREIIQYDGKEYNGAEYMEEDVSVGLVAIVYCIQNHDELMLAVCKRQPRYVFCFQPEAINALASSFHAQYFLLEDNCFVEYRSLYAIQADLNAIHRDFLIPSAISKHICIQNGNTLPLQSGDTLVYNKLSRCFSRCHDEQVCISTVQDEDATSSAAENNETGMDHVASKPRLFSECILFLGTGCAIPSKYRNVSVILYESESKAMLLDCGEDALFQIHRAYGSIDVLRKLRAIFISHSHADHVLGIVSVLRALDHKVNVFGPASIKPFISKFGVENYRYIETNHAKALERRFRKKYDGLMNDQQHHGTFCTDEYVLKFDTEFEISICGVDHCSDSCGIRIKDGKVAVAYSGDSRASNLFALMSHNSDIMIHEATFTSDQADRAAQTHHSTVADAIGVFKMSNSNNLLLTHFSQRYPKGIASSGEWIPCVDLFRYVVGSEYPMDRINEYYKSTGIINEYQ